MKTINILFLGASKRVSLIERFIAAAKALCIKLNIYSCEINNEFYPISAYAKILKGPTFGSRSFPDWLIKTIKSKNINIIIPNMDSATVALSRVAKRCRSINGCWPVVSDYSLCRTMEDKSLANSFFNEHGIKTPNNTKGKFPKIIKPKLGFGSKGIVSVKNSSEMSCFLSNNSISEYIVQDYIPGQETTVDAYFSKNSGLIGYVLRDRKDVSDGEVMVCHTRKPTGEESKLIERIASIPGWVGCITLQYITGKNGRVNLIELNPRFGGGCTCAIEAGLDMPRYLLSEYLGLKYKLPKRIKKIKMTRARRDFFSET